MDNDKNPTVPPEEALRLSGLKSDVMLIYLSRIGVLKPSGDERAGRGRRRRFTFNDVVFLKAVANLLAQGIEVKRLGNALRQAKADADQWMDIRKAPIRYLITDGTDVFFRKEGQLESLTVKRQFAFGFVIDLHKAHKAVADAWPSAPLAI